MADIRFGELSDEQRGVVECDDQYISVLASAGSGKTEVVAQRVERLLHDSAEDFKVLALSYTRRAAAELRDRFANRLGDNRTRVETDTLHGFAQRLLFQYGTWIGLPANPTIIVDDADRVELLQAWRQSSGLDDLVDARTQLLELDLCRAQAEPHPLASEWQDALADAGALDYESMLARATELLDLGAIGATVSRIYRYIIVDEAQNLTKSQYVFLERFLKCSKQSSALLVGDDKQSIVEFAGASVEYLQTFIKTFEATEFHLTRNFRSAKVIVQLGDAIASVLGDSPSVAQNYAAHGMVEKRIFSNEAAEASGIAAWVENLLEQGIPREALSPSESPDLIDRDIAILARSAAALRTTEEELRKAGVPIARSTHADDWLMSDFGRITWSLGTFRPESAISRRKLARVLGLLPTTSAEDIRAKLIKDGLEDLVLILEDNLPENFIQIVSSTESNKEGWFEDREEILLAWAAFCEQNSSNDRNWPQFELFVNRWQRGDDDNPGVRIQTVHKSQGREFKVVALIGMNEGQFPDFRASDDKSMRAELRAFYVASTRASRYLLLTRPESRMSRNGPWTRPESRFFKFVP
ncbi:ATP-dependent helicase [Rhodococcus erythropolis]|uniref:ATP-dependent helicase n=1 Tax=Rhodococcus erythropolis TaxID=1833 RepID=UPI001BAA84E1|nr:ATP-dependent helicase [Rhodococcus erythropolis]MBS2987913.1 ATP-dependent helicase [Rhodococcus erythropolis]